MPNDMFLITNPTLKSTITEGVVDFPRYQRNKAWTDDDKFKLFVSVFKSYPLGSIVVKELIEGEKYWILDGRQRYETIRDMQNPETVYLWAKHFCKFKDTESSEEIKENLLENLSDYLGYEINPATDSWFSDLSEVICTVHPFKKKRGCDLKSSGFRNPFIYKNFKPNYVIDMGDCVDADSNKLLSWILGSGLTKFGNIEDLTSEQIASKYDVKDEEKNQLIKELDSKLHELKKSLKIVKIIQTAMQKNQISLITLGKTCRSSDEMKIFEIVNTGGKKLNNAQIRSAKKQWNYEVSKIINDDHILEYRENLYKAQNLNLTESCVSWDFAATFIDRLEECSDVLLSKDYRNITYDMSSSKDKMEFGFKLLCARYKSSVTKEDIDKLPENDFDWSTNCVGFASEINTLSKYLIDVDPVFKHFYEYGFSIDNLGQNASICFLILAIKLSKKYENPKSGHKFHEFIQNIRIMLDSFIYEYISDVWKGSSDSLLESRLKNGYDIKKINTEQWNAVIDDLYLYNELNIGKKTENKLKVLTYYFTAIRNKNIRCDEKGLHIDHIIPRSQFTDSTADEYKTFEDSLINYALLPSHLNKEKSDWVKKMLQPHKEEICGYEDIDLKDIEKITAASDIPNLKEMRNPIIDKVKQKREEYTNCSGYWIVN